MSLIVGQIRPDWSVLSTLEFEKKNAIFDFGYTLASTYKYQLPTNMLEIYMTIRSLMSWIMGLIGPEQNEFPSVRVAVFGLVYNVESQWVYDSNLEIFMFKPKRPRAMMLCMKQQIVNLYKFCIQDAPGIIMGPTAVLKHMYIGICLAIIRKFSG